MNSLNKKKREIRSLFPKKDVLLTIDLLKNFLLEESKAFKTILLIEGRFRKIRRENQQGIISYEIFTLEDNKLRKMLLDFIDDIEWEETQLCIITDQRDGHRYRTIKILGKTWMAENLNFYSGKDSRYYDGDLNNRKEYGCLYSWDLALKVCPEGWRLPTVNEIDDLIKHCGGHKEAYKKLMKGGVIGFDAKLGGYVDCDSDHSYRDIGREGIYWTSSPEHDGGLYVAAYSFHVQHEALNWDYTLTLAGCSCRCVKDF